MDITEEIKTVIQEAWNNREKGDTFGDFLDRASEAVVNLIHQLGYRNNFKLISDEWIPLILQRKYPHMFKGNDKRWCDMQIQKYSEFLKMPEVQNLLQAQLDNCKE